MTNKEQIRNGVIAGIILIVVPFFFQVVRDSVVSSAKWLAFTSISLPMWVALFLTIITLLSVLYVLLYFLARTSEPEWKAYTQDTFDGLVWRWTYSSAGEPTNPLPYCPMDDTLMPFQKITLNGRIKFICETCNKESRIYNHDIYDVQNKILRQIDRKIRNKEY